MALYPHFETITEKEINSKLFQGACRVGKYGPASRDQIDYLASLFVRNEASRAMYQDFAVNTSGNLPAKKASKMIEKLLVI